MLNLLAILDPVKKFNRATYRCGMILDLDPDPEFGDSGIGTIKKWHCNTSSYLLR